MSIDPFTWTEELAIICFILSIYTSASLAVTRRQHLRIKTLHTLVNPKSQKILDLVCNAVFIVVMLVLGKGMFVILGNLFKYSPKYIATGIPKYVVYGIIGICFYLMVIRLIQDSIKLYREYRHRQQLQGLYPFGNGPDRTVKTPGWASGITGIPKERIVQLAREIGAAKPVYIAQGWGPQRHANGEQSARAICMLPILTGNVGIQGGNSGAREAPYGLGFPPFPTGRNPVAAAIPCFLWTKAINDHENFTDTREFTEGRSHAHGWNKG